MNEVKPWKWSEIFSVVSDSLRPHRLYSPWNSPGQNTGVGSLSLLQGIFPTPWIQPRPPALQADSLPAEPPEQPKNTGVRSPRILGWEAYPFSSSSSRLRNRSQVSCIAGGFFTNWAIRESPQGIKYSTTVVNTFRDWKWIKRSMK